MNEEEINRLDEKAAEFEIRGYKDAEDSIARLTDPLVSSEEDGSVSIHIDNNRMGSEVPHVERDAVRRERAELIRRYK